MAAREAAAGGGGDGFCPYHSGHEEQLAHLESFTVDLKDRIQKTDEHLLDVDKRLVAVSTTVKVGAAVGAAVGSASGVVIGLLIAWLK